MFTLLYDYFARVSVHWKHGIKYVTAMTLTSSLSSRMVPSKEYTRNCVINPKIL